MTVYTVLKATFEDFFRYQELANGSDNSFVADEFLLQNFIEPKPDNSLGFRQRTRLLNKLMETPDLTPYQDVDEFTFQGKTFTFVDPPGAYLYQFRALRKKSEAQAVRNALETCYLVNGRPLKECIGELTFKDAQVLMSNTLSFFRDSSEPEGSDPANADIPHSPAQ